jgi:tellurite resistance protein TerC
MTSNLPVLFPFAEYWWFYLAFTGFVIGLLALDLGVFHRKAHAVSFKEATIWTCVWVTLALTFNVLLYYYAQWDFSNNETLMAIPGFDPAKEAGRIALEFLAGYLVEQSLSVDNIFVFVLVFSYFHVKPQYQHRVLFYGILGALIFRGIFIAVGAVLMQYKVVVYLLGAFLVFTGFKMLFGGETKIEPEKNPITKLFKKIMPVSHEYEGQKFFSRKGGVLHATPLFIVLLVLEVTDVVFAIDSVPAIFGLTKEPLIVFTSNIFAILGLRSLYFLLAGAVDKFHFLKFGLAVVLTFVGLKMTVLTWWLGGHFPIGWSLGIIGGTLFLSIMASLAFPKKETPHIHIEGDVYDDKGRHKNKHTHIP